MIKPAAKSFLMPLLTPLLLLSFYSTVEREALWALVLSSVMIVVLGGVVLAVRSWLPLRGLQFLLILLTALTAQAVWFKLQLMPWWSLAALSLLWNFIQPPVEPEGPGLFFLQVFLLESAALCFLALHGVLDLTAARDFWNHPAGHFSLLGVVALLLGVVERGGTRAV